MGFGLEGGGLGLFSTYRGVVRSCWASSLSEVSGFWLLAFCSRKTGQQLVQRSVRSVSDRKSVERQRTGGNFDRFGTGPWVPFSIFGSGGRH